jgi:hypothetical protein
MFSMEDLEMDLQAQRSERRFSAYVEGIVSVIGHAGRGKPRRLLPADDAL